MINNAKKIASILLAHEKRRETLLVLGIVAAMPVDYIEEGNHTTTLAGYPSWIKIHGIISEVNEHLLIKVDDVLEDIKTSWIARLRDVYRPFDAMREKASWDECLHDLDKEELDLCQLIQKEVALCLR